ncbi:MAG: hypothetical protein K0S18_627 [Anaerocolumna sp.]|nr:hypothetical protein [Anaerocolumna sp.]
MDKYTARINLMGSTKRERDLNRLKQTILNDAPQTLSCKDVKIGDVDRKLIINESTIPYKKDLITLPNENILVGDYVIWENETWLAIEADSDDEIYTTGKMQLCNYNLKWQDSTGTILSYPCIDETTLSVGLDEGNVITTPNSTHKIKLPFDFMIDDSTVEVPQVFVISNPNRTEFKYGDKGIIELTMKADNYNALTDNIALGVCNYFSPTTPPEPSPINYTMTITHDMDLIVNNTLWCTFTPTLKDENGAVVTSWTANWSFNYNGMDESKFIIEYDGNDCKVKVVDESYDVVDNVLGLTCTSDNGTIGNYNIVIGM